MFRTKTQSGLLTKNILCTEPHIIWDSTHTITEYLQSLWKKNMVFTVEPGIYIPEEGFGIRLEDDVVIQESGAPLNLMKNIPIVADEIESILQDSK